MPSMQPQASTPARPCRFSHTALASAAAFVDGSAPYLINFVQINAFAGAEERS
ncbi:hypothetical protein [Pseudomonas sp. IT-347P]|uniref:hypothetical protein n=1 Tax=Pseudomonas sp. IT-347P TaxID=3026458 RepID=UPI0039E1D8E6